MRQFQCGTVRIIPAKVIIAVKPVRQLKRGMRLCCVRALEERELLPGKLTDCQSKRAEDSELFIVEGTQLVVQLRWVEIERLRLFFRCGENSQC